MPAAGNHRRNHLNTAPLILVLTCYTIRSYQLLHQPNAGRRFWNTLPFFPVLDAKVPRTYTRGTFSSSNNFKVFLNSELAFLVLLATIAITSPCNNTLSLFTLHDGGDACSSNGSCTTQVMYSVRKVCEDFRNNNVKMKPLEATSWTTEPNHCL